MVKVVASIAHRTGLACVMAALASCGADPCGKDGGAAVTIRSLDKTALARLFDEATQAQGTGETPMKALKLVPYAWQREPRLRRYGDSGQIVLAYCFDHGTQLKLERLGSSTGGIVLMYGEP